MAVRATASRHSTESTAAKDVHNDHVRVSFAHSMAQTVRATVITMREVSVRKVSALLSMTMPSRVSAVRMDSVHVSTGAMAAAAIITEMAIIVAAMASRTATITSRGATVQDITTIMKGK